MPVSVLFDIVTDATAGFPGAVAPGTTTYEMPESSNVFVVSIDGEVTGTPAVVTLTLNSIGEADITVTVTQQTGPAPQFEQKATATFKVIVVS